MSRCPVALVPFSIVMLAGACLGPPARTGPEPVYTSAEGHWRYVPLSERERDRPEAGDFQRMHARCTGETSEAERLVECLGTHGFYRTQCDDGLDNDGDGLVDHPQDPGCSEPLAIREDPECDDGRDNDGDGLVDWDGGGVAHPDTRCEGDASGDDEADPRSRPGWLPPYRATSGSELGRAGS